MFPKKQPCFDFRYESYQNVAQDLQVGLMFTEGFICTWGMNIYKFVVKIWMAHPSIVSEKFHAKPVKVNKYDCHRDHYKA